MIRGASFELLCYACVVAALGYGCRAEDTVKQGEAREVCNGRDTDCRPGLICEAGLCTAPGPSPTYDCGDICARLQGCDSAPAGCESECRITTNDWALRAREDFGVCLVEDLSCEEALQSFAPQTCYTRIELPEGRFDQCEDLAYAALDCGAEIGAAERVLEGCVAVARVQPDEVWVAAGECAVLAETGNCSELATCFTQRFELDPPIQFVTF